MQQIFGIKISIPAENFRSGALDEETALLI